MFTFMHQLDKVKRNHKFKYYARTEVTTVITNI